MNYIVCIVSPKLKPKELFPQEQYGCIFCYNKKEDSFASGEAGKTDVSHSRYITSRQYEIRETIYINASVPSIPQESM
jgi:hypothetical protein